MNIIKHKGWTFTRTVGQGEIENVRALLLQVFALSTQSLDAQIAGVIQACNLLQMRGRVFINAELLGDEALRITKQTVLAHAKEHDLIELEHSDESFISAMDKVDVVIQPGKSEISADEVSAALLKLWAETGGRGSICNSRAPTEEQLYQLRGEFSVNMKACRKAFDK